MIIAQQQPELVPVTVHVVPLDIDDERIHALLDRYLEVIHAGGHPPFPYVAAVFSELYAITQARRAAEALP